MAYIHPIAADGALEMPMHGREVHPARVAVEQLHRAPPEPARASFETVPKCSTFETATVATTATAKA